MPSLPYDDSGGSGSGGVPPAGLPAPSSGVPALIYVEPPLGNIRSMSLRIKVVLRPAIASTGTPRIQYIGTRFDTVPY